MHKYTTSSRYNFVGTCIFFFLIIFYSAWVLYHRSWFERELTKVWPDQGDSNGTKQKGRGRRLPTAHPHLAVQGNTLRAHFGGV